MKRKMYSDCETGLQKLIREKKMKEKMEEMDEAMMKANIMAMVPKMKFGKK